MAGAEPLYLMERLPGEESFILDYNRKTTEHLYRRGFYERPKTNILRRIRRPGEPEPEHGWDFNVNSHDHIIANTSSGKMLGKSIS